MEGDIGTKDRCHHWKLVTHTAHHIFTVVNYKIQQVILGQEHKYYTVQ